MYITIISGEAAIFPNSNEISKWQNNVNHVGAIAIATAKKSTME